MQFLGRLRHPVRQKDPAIVAENIFRIRTEVERLGFVLSDESGGAVSFTATPGRNVNQSNLLQKIEFANQYGNRIAKELGVEFDFVKISD